MTLFLRDKRILLGVCGGIAAYKTADWVRELRRAGAEVRVVMTASAARFVTPLTFAALSGNPVHGSMFAEEEDWRIPHIALGRESDVILVAPATAQTIARLAQGQADDLLAAVILAARCPVVLCPAMNSAMYLHPATRSNLEKCRSFGYTIIEAEQGPMACGEEGPGRLVSWMTVRDHLETFFSPSDLTGQQVLVTAGPTREPIDAARLITNRSSGKMGYALARAALARGAQVTLISGPVAAAPPTHARLIAVTTGMEMHQAVMAHWRQATVVVMAAAVADFQPANPTPGKIKKSAAAKTLRLVANPDILKELGSLKQDHDWPLLVGFAAETDNHESEGRRKLMEKNADLIVVNDIAGSDQGFEVETNKVMILDRQGRREEVPLLSKDETAHRIWDAVVRLLEDKC